MRLRTAPELAAGGDAVARAPDGRVVFITGAAPDELVEVAVDEDNRTFLRAHVTTVVTPSAARQVAPCPYFRGEGGLRCGGCTLQHVAPSAQTRSKHRAVVETLARIGKVDTSQVLIAEPWSGESEGYRARARFAVSGEGGKGRRVGFRGAKSREVVDVASCLVLSPSLQRALDRLREAVAELPSDVRIPRDLEIEAVAVEGAALVGLPKKLAALADHLREDDVVHLARTKDDVLVDADDERGSLLLHPEVFAQGNAAGNRAMVDEVDALVTELAKGRIGELVELYSGSGNFTRRLAFLADHLRAYETSADAVHLARRVLPSSVELSTLSAEDALLRLVGEGASIDVLVLDPPRAGVTPEVVDRLAELRPRAIVYVSCDPATFARDVGRMSAAGVGTLDHLRVFDLYPHTAHVEVIGRLTRRAP